MAEPLLTIGMATYDDPQGVWWTLSSLRLHHVGIHDPRIELLVINDHPKECQDLTNACANAGARLINKSKNLGPAHAKNTIWEQATGQHVLMLDCHVLLGNGSIKYIIEAIKQDKIGKDMWVGPLVNERGGIIATELLPQLRGEFFGIWHVAADQPNKIREVHAHGSAYALMRRDCWPGFSEHFRGFAGEEIYIHEKVRRAGGKVLYHPALSWSHRFCRFAPVPYSLTINDKARNYLIAAHEMGWNIGQFQSYFAKRLARDQMIVVEREVAAIYPDAFTRDCSDIPKFREID